LPSPPAARGKDGDQGRDLWANDYAGSLTAIDEFMAVVRGDSDLFGSPLAFIAISKGKSGHA
jgi:hypothetical protein